jgi:F-box/WD-40 domain protein MET30
MVLHICPGVLPSLMTRGRGPSPPEILTAGKTVYSERMKVELKRKVYHTNPDRSYGGMCLQFGETLSHPAFPVLISGSYDRTVRVWNMETGEQLHCLRGHTRAVRALH